MRPGSLRTGAVSRPRPRRLTARWSVAAFTAAAVLSAAPVSAQFDVTGPPTVGVPDLSSSPAAGFSDRFGLDVAGGEYTTIGADAAWALVDSSYSLAAVDPLSGVLIPDDVGSVISPDRLVVNELFDAGLLLSDVAASAEAARAAADAHRMAQELLANQMVPFSDCGSPGNVEFVAKQAVVAAWERMCADAEADGVTLEIVSAYRSPQRQAELYRAAVAKYGSDTAARRWVAYSDGSDCSSKHCAGTAIDVNVSSDPAARAWLHASVGCYAADGVRLGSGSCVGGRTVKRVSLYGFVLPLPHEPWHLELATPA